jgi:hypothetical protein
VSPHFRRMMTSSLTLSKVSIIYRKVNRSKNVLLRSTMFAQECRVHNLQRLQHWPRVYGDYLN